MERILTWCRYIHINEIWDRISKILILIIDAALNYYFARVVKERLVDQGLTKYDALVRFNIKIMLISIAMDVSLTQLSCLLLWLQLKVTLAYLRIIIDYDYRPHVTHQPNRIHLVPSYRLSY